jgi:3alpha(or 20beta)-hydroxysteroid dehydrogenase
MQPLADRTAIVTGAARGAGAVIARRLVEAGARVVLGDIRVEAGEAVARQLGDVASFVPLDVTREEDWQRAVEHTLSLHAGIDVLVNNAGRLHIGTIQNTTPEQARSVVDVNLIGPFLGIRAVTPSMKARRKGSIVNDAIADAVLFLASDASRHCTGVDLPVDGGAHAGRFLRGFNEF